jgi:hypothetical protein
MDGHGDAPIRGAPIRPHLEAAPFTSATVVPIGPPVHLRVTYPASRNKSEYAANYGAMWIFVPGVP